jgi:hypothetical protein
VKIAKARRAMGKALSSYPSTKSNEREREIIPGPWFTYKMEIVNVSIFKLVMAPN